MTLVPLYYIPLSFNLFYKKNILKKVICTQLLTPIHSLDAGHKVNVSNYPTIVTPYKLTLTRQCPNIAMPPPLSAKL